MKSRNGGAPKSSTKDSFITSTINTFRKKPVVIHKNTAIFFFETHESKEIWLTIQKNINEYCYSWIKDTKNGMERISIDLPSKTPLYRDNPKRNTTLIKKLTSKYKFPKEDLETFIEELGLYLKEKEAEIFKENEDSQETEEDKTSKNPYNCFDDYPEDIKEAAIKIIKSKNPLNALKNGIGTIHQGDDVEIEISILQHFTNRVLNGEAVHGRVGGGTDAGKSDLVLNTLKIVPKRFQQNIQTLSSKSLFYDDELRDDYNHIIINDFLDSPDALGLIKVMTDNLMDFKKHKTVLDTKDGKKGITLEIPGNNIVIITAAKDINDVETNRRFLHLNPKEDQHHKNKVKSFIMESGIIGAQYTDLTFEILQATFDYLTKDPVNVFNPWIYCMDLENKGFTDIKMFINLVKARSLIFRKHRPNIEDNTILGSKEDVIEVMKLWNAIAPMQQYKFSRKQVELLNLLEEYDPEESYNPQGYFIGGKTYNEIAEELEVKRDTIYTWINGYYNKEKQTGKPGLSELGFVLTKQKDPDKEKSPKLIYLNPDKKEFIKSLKNGFNYVNLTEIKLSIGFNIPNPKNKVIELYLGYVNFRLKPYKTHIHTHQDLQNLSKSVKTDEDVYNIIKKVNSVIKELPKNEDHDPITYMYNTLINKKVQQAPKTEDKALNDNPKDESYINQKLNKDNKGKNPKEGLESNIPINVIEAAKNILQNEHEGVHILGFKTDLSEILLEDNKKKIIHYKDKLIKEGYIKVGKFKYLLIPTKDLLNFERGG